MTLDKVNHLSVYTSILSYMIENILDVLCITLNIENEKVMKMKFTFIYRYNNSCIDTEEAAGWLLYSSLAYVLMNE